MNSRLLLLVNEADEVVGTGEKLWVHEQALLHRAFSIFIFNEAGQMLIQRRALSKYHSGGLWTNACCSHPIAEEDLETTLHDRLQDEIGLDCELAFQFKFIYKAAFENGLTEHELDYVYFGETNQQPTLNPEEADAFRWIAVKDLLHEIKTAPETFTVWFKIIMGKIEELG
jgi:isopentenyl-diphosphate Delta-isomerase